MQVPSIILQSPSQPSDVRTALPKVHVSIDQSSANTKERSRNNGSMKMKSNLKLEKFSGEQGNVVLFLKRFEICSRHFDWDASERLDQLICSLCAPADQILVENGCESIVSAEILIEKLRAIR